MKLDTSLKQTCPENLDDGLNHYLNLWEKGLKKQANQYIRIFLQTLEETIVETSFHHILEEFCYKYFDQVEYLRLKELHGSILPHELNRVLWHFLKKKCDQRCMPHMRWICQMYEGYYNPFDPKREYEPERILEQAYHHKQCDQKTVDMYLQIQLDWLRWGAHHFPDCCLTTKQLYFDTVNKIETIIKEHPVDVKQLDVFHYFTTLYTCYYQYEESGKTKDYYQICEDAGLQVI